MTGSTPSRGGETLGSWRVALRLAWRSALRNMTRSLLIVLMLAVPVFAASTLLLTWSASYGSAEREASWQLGQADLWLDGDGIDEAVRSLPAGSSTLAFQTGQTIARHNGNHTKVEYWAADVAAPMNAGKYVLRSGTVPVAADQVALTDRLARSLGLDVGGTISAGMPLRDLTVVGIIDTADRLGREALIVAAAHPLSAGGRTRVMVDLPETAANWSPDKRLQVGYLSREGLRPTVAEQAVRTAGLTLVVGFASVQIMLLAAAAFAVGARRQQRELAMIGAVGATRQQISRLVLANGLVLGLCAGLCGVLLGLVVFRFSSGLVERLVDHPLSSARPALLPLAGVALLAVLVGVGAAFGPARTVSRQPIRQTLVGRLPTPHQHGRRFLRAGAALAALGAVVAVYGASPGVASVTLAVVGAILVLLGLAATAPAAVELLGRIAGPAPLTLRLALRHAARHQFRTAAAVAAVCAAVAGSVGISLFLSADTRTGAAAQPDVRPGQILLTAEAARIVDAGTMAELRRVLPVRDVVPLTTAAATALFSWAGAPDQVPPDVPPTVAVGGPEVVELVTGRAPGADVTQALENGGAVTFYPYFVDNGTTTLTTGDGQAVTLPGHLVAVDRYYRSFPSVLVSPKTAERLTLSTGPAGTALTTTRSPNADELAAAESLLLSSQLRAAGDAPADPVKLTLGVRPEAESRTDPMVYVLAAVSGLVTLLAGAIAVGLATSEMRDDLSTLVAVGASPRLHRWLAAAQAGLIVGLGTLLGLAAGTAPAAGLVALRDDLSWRLPWWLPPAVLIGLPLLAVLGTAALSRPRFSLVRRLT